MVKWSGSNEERLGETDTGMLFTVFAGVIPKSWNMKYLRLGGIAFEV